MKDNNEFKKLEAIDEITKNLDLKVDIHKAVEEGMEKRLRKKTYRFFIMASAFAIIVGCLASKVSPVNITILLSLVFACLIPVSITLCLKSLKGGKSHGSRI